MLKKIAVVGAVIVADGLVLCAQRGPHGNLPGMWEFPGGKVEAGETRKAALQREIAEELACTVDVGREVMTTTYLYDFGEVTLTTFYCSLIEGTPRLTEHASLRWLPIDELRQLAWAPADIPAVARIQDDLG